MILKRGKDVRLITRRGNNLAGSFPELVSELVVISGDYAIDGELVVLDDKGLPVFERLMRRARTRLSDSALKASKRDPAAIFVFDALAIGKRDLRKLPLLERKARLNKLLKGAERVRYAGHIGMQGLQLFSAAEKLGLEGSWERKRTLLTPLAGPGTGSRSRQRRGKRVKKYDSIGPHS